MFSSKIMDYVISRAELISGNEVPVFSVVAIGSNIISESQNYVEKFNKPWMHAEFLALQEACELLNSKYLDNADIYINLEPCSFCAAMLEKVRIKNIFFGAYDPKCGAIIHNARIFDHSTTKPNIIGGIQEERCSNIISSFFKSIRKND